MASTYRVHTLSTADRRACHVCICVSTCMQAGADLGAGILTLPLTLPNQAGAALGADILTAQWADADDEVDPYPYPYPFPLPYPYPTPNPCLTLTLIITRSTWASSSSVSPWTTAHRKVGDR